MSLSAELELVDVGEFLRTGNDEAACKCIADCLSEFGAVLISDSRVAESDSVLFRALMERYACRISLSSYESIPSGITSDSPFLPPRQIL
jgi:hypothetical protein